MAVNASTACQRCRGQKLRCSRERPKCARCTRLDSTCVFPDPPDRKLLAARRERLKTSTSEIPASTTNLGFVTRSRSSPNDPADDVVSHAVSTPNDIDVLALPTAVQNLLQRVYFTCTFNSTMLFHPPTFYRLFNEGKIPMHNLFAVYAMATIFLEPSSSLAEENATLLRPLGDLYTAGEAWAVRAGKEILQDIDKPTFHALRTCQILTLYWFGVGDGQRNTMFSGIAYKAARVLKIDDNGSKMYININENNPEWLEAETIRRLFWAIWQTQCVNADHDFTSNPVDTRTSRLFLPISEANYHDVVQQSPICLAELECSQPQRSDHIHSRDCSIIAEAMYLIAIWAKIRNHRLEAESITNHEWLARFFTFETELSTWSARLPHAFKYSKRTLYEHIRPEERQVYILVHAVYAQSRLILHLFLVPQLGGLDFGGRFPAELTSMSAQVTLRMAQRISEIGSDLLALDWNPSQLPPFFGYCLYVSASVHIVFLSAKDAALANLARSHLLCNLQLMRLMKRYWANIRQLWTRISILYESQRNSIRQKPQGTSGAPTAFQSSLDEISELVREHRDLAQLSEPLATSVLGYTLSGLTRHPTEDTVPPRDLERTVDIDQYSGRSREGLHDARVTSNTIFPTSQVFNDQSSMYVGTRLDTEQPGQSFHNMLPVNPGSVVSDLDWFQWNMTDFRDSMTTGLDILDYNPSL